MRSPTESTGVGPAFLTVPGIDNSGPHHWQTLWESDLEDCMRVDLGMRRMPHRNTWVNKLNNAVAGAGRPVILVAHSLGCHTVAWWNQLERAPASKVLGALLVAPPCLSDLDADSRLAAFAPLARSRLRFPSILAASRDDPYASFGQSRKMARLWGSRLVDAGWLGHINADSGIAAWPFGRHLLERLVFNLKWPPVARTSGGIARSMQSGDLRLGLD